MSIEKAQKRYDKKLARIRKNREIEQTEINKLQQSLNERYDKKEAKLKEKFSYLFISNSSIQEEKVEEKVSIIEEPVIKENKETEEKVVEKEQPKKSTKKEKKEVEKETKKSENKKDKETEDKKEKQTKKTVKKETKKQEEPIEELKQEEASVAQEDKQQEDAEKETKQRRSLYRVIYDKEDRKWIIKKDGNEKITKKVNTKKEALEIVEKLCENQNLKMVVHKKDGKFQKHNNIKKSSNKN